MLLSYMLVTGEFGIVYKAHLLQVEDDDIIVAVKTLIGNTCIMHTCTYVCIHSVYYTSQSK